MSTTLELLRARVEFHQRRCRASYDITTVHPGDIFYQAFGFHTECQQLRDAEAELAAAEKKTKRAP